MLGRAVYSVQNEWRWPSVDKLMLCASWNDDEVASLDVLIFAGNGRFAFSRGEGEDLVNGVFLQEAWVSRRNWKWRLEQDALNPMVPTRSRLDVPRRQSLHLLGLS